MLIDVRMGCRRLIIDGVLREGQKINKMRVVNGCLHAMPSSLLHCAFLFLQFFCTVSSSFENDGSKIAPSGCLFPAVSTISDLKSTPCMEC